MGKSRRLSRASVEDAAFDENDDEAERNALRAARDAEAERVKSPHAASKQGRPAGAAAPGGSDGPAAWGEIAEVYADCIKMCNDNKVNEKNSWSLNLIDHMGDVLAKPGAPGSASTAHAGDSDNVTNFQVASCTLDAGVKIYSYRVDSVYSTAYRVLGGLNRTGAAPGEDEAEDDAGDAEGGAEGAEGAAPAPKKTRAKPARSVASTLSSASQLDGKTAASAAVSDPLFHKLCAKFDIGGARGLLLANMALHGSDGLSLLFDGEGELEHDDDAELAAAERTRRGEGAAPGSSWSPLAAADLVRLAPSPSEIHALGVCEALCSFVDGKMAELGQPNHYGEGIGVSAAQAADPSAGLDGQQPAGSASVSASAEPTAQPWVRDEAANSECGSYAEHDGAAAFGDDDDDDDERAREAEEYVSHLAAAVAGGGDEDDNGAGADLRLFGSLAAARGSSPARVAAQAAGAAGPVGECGDGAIVGYESEALDLYRGGAMPRGTGWAGPAHWRWRSAAAAGGEAKPAAAARGGRKAKEVLLLDVAKADHVANAAAVRVKPVRGTTKLTAAALSKAAAEPLTLPFDHRLTMDDLTALFGRPHVKATRLRVLRAGGTGNPGAEGTCSAHGLGAHGGGQGAFGEEAIAEGAGSDDDEGASFGVGGDEYGDYSGFSGAADGSGGAGADSTEAPAAWAATQAGGAEDGAAPLDWLAAPTTVAFVDVSYAKVAKKVNIRMLKESLWNVIDHGTASPSAPAAQVLSAQLPQQSFKAAMSTLAKKAPPEALKDVSVAYCFICLLHLANEKGLQVKGTDDLSDLTVFKPSVCS